jgi:hypothetical protein
MRNRTAVRVTRGVGFAAALFLWASVAVLEGQGVEDASGTPAPIVTGQVIDQITGDDLSSARITFIRISDGASVWEGLSSSSGLFRTEPLSETDYEVVISALGYSEVRQAVTLVGPGSFEMRVELTPEALALDGFVVTTRRQTVLEAYGFYDRRRQGIGRTFTREEIEARNPPRVSDIFYGVAGARVTPRQPGQASQILLRGGCVPDLMIDGMPVRGPVVIDDLLTVSDLEALEIYQGASSPVGYSRFDCGTIMAWTRTGGTVEDDPFGWRRFITAAGFFGITLLLAP